MEKQGESALIVGLGNPGTKYEKTRHNFGFLVLEALAERYHVSLKREKSVQGKEATLLIQERQVHLLMPSTYMNLSGTAVRKALRHFNVHPKQLLVVVDDVYLSFGAMRFRGMGGTGGHNGLKHIQACLETQDYPRLRMGVGPQEELVMALEEYVLADFTLSEQQELPQLIEKGIAIVEEWLKLGEEAASLLAGNLSKRPPE